MTLVSTTDTDVCFNFNLTDVLLRFVLPEVLDVCKIKIRITLSLLDITSSRLTV